MPAASATPDPRGRSARMVVGVPGMPRVRKRQFLRGAAEREFMQRLLAQHDRARRPQAGDDGSVLAGDVVEQDFGVAGGRQAGDVDVVLEAVGHAMERTKRAPVGDVLLGLACGIECGLGVDADERTDPRVVGLDPGDQGRDQFDRREPAGRIGGADFGRREPLEVFHRPLRTCIGGHGSLVPSTSGMSARSCAAARAASATQSGNLSTALPSPAARAIANISGVASGGGLPVILGPSAGGERSLFSTNSPEASMRSAAWRCRTGLIGLGSHKPRCRLR